MNYMKDRLIEAIKRSIRNNKQAIVALMDDCEIESSEFSLYQFISGNADSIFTFNDVDDVDELFKLEKHCLPKIVRVIFSDRATIVFWSDGTKTVVRCSEGELFSEYNGVINAIAKKACGGTSKHFHETVYKAIKNAELYASIKSRQKAEGETGK